MADRLAPAGDVHVAAVCSVPLGDAALHIVLTGSLALIVVPSDARLSEVVKAGPYDVSDYVGIRSDGLPVAEGAARVALGLPDDTLGGALMVGGVLVEHIVVADYVQDLGVRVEVLPYLTGPCAESFGDGAAVINFQNGFFQHPGSSHNRQLVALYNFVAKAPRNY